MCGQSEHNCIASGTCLQKVVFPKTLRNKMGVLNADEEVGDIGTELVFFVNGKKVRKYYDSTI